MKNIHKHRKPISVFFLVLLLSEIFAPYSAFALTGGPSQPEVQSFESANTNQMVDMFSGDFVYNIPLMDVGGYPVNMSYHSGITMDQEASWVGLGWNLQPGSITRNMRGLPDDFMGDPITKEYNLNPNWTAGLDLGAGVKFINFPLGLNVNMGVYYNNYRGVGFKGGTGFQYSFSQGSGGKNTESISESISLGVSFDSQNGIGVSPGLGLSMSEADGNGGKTSEGINAGLSYNSRQGITALTISADVSYTHQNQTTHKTDRQESIGSSSTISFASQAVTPTIDFPMSNFGFTAKVQVGGEVPVIAADISGNITGNFSQQWLLYNTETLGGYGYLYFDKAHQGERALLDFNREKDQPFRKPRPMMHDEGTPLLAIPNYEFDLYQVTGQGVGGQYRIQRTDVGNIYDHHVEYQTGSGALSLDVGIGGYAHIGGNINVDVVNTETGNWETNNELHNQLGFSSYNNTDYEPAAFENIGEKTIAEQDIYNEYGGDDPFLIQLGGYPFIRQATKSIQAFHQGVPSMSGELNHFKRAKRDKRNQPVSYLTAYEGQYAAIDTAILDYPENSYPLDICNGIPPSVNSINRVAQANGRGHHISEVTVLGTDGRRYVYGIPAYNRTRRDVTFNVSPDVGNPETGLANYQALGTNPPANSINNNIGLDHFFSAENIPDYAHSYLLTSVLSADYVDLTGNGPSDDDYGDYVRMNYTRVYPSSDPNSNGQLYNWRVPYNQANYQQGYKSYGCDDKGNYSYGTKEMWLPNSIESKTMIAIFHISDREDAVGVKDEDGGMGSPKSRVKKLDRIDLYSKADLEQHGNNAIPIKSVYFTYDYSLCPNVDNNTGNPVDVHGNPTSYGPNNVNANRGKLTLKQVYFTYQGNTKGRLNPYVFHYDGNINPPYHIKHYDRWGNYKSNKEYYEGQLLQSSYVMDPEYPYTIQDTNYTNKAAGAWSLSQIDLPTGGSIKVKLESDSYAYVQNKQAMEMFQVLGTGRDSTVNNNAYDNRFFTGAGDNDQNQYIFVKVDAPITSTGYGNIQSEINSKYLNGISNLYYRFAIKMYDTDNDSVAEYVPGWCQIQSYGLVQGKNNVLWLKLQPQPKGNSGNGVVNPIAKNAFQFLRTNLPSRAYPGSSNLGSCGDGTPSTVGMIKSLIAPIFDIENIFMGFAGSCMLRSWCKYMIPGRCWVRLDNALGNKLGGGARVKQVTITDNWNEMVPGAPPATYGQVYDYTLDGVKSSGVAEYEPMPGGDENPFRQPLLYTVSSILAPNNQLYMEYPLCESFYPGAGVGYSQVKVTSFGSTQVSADKRTGYSVHKYYTANDFPVITDYTPKSFIYDNTNPILAILKLPMLNFLTASQGFSIQLNDMHGKVKSEEVYDNLGAIVSKTSYTYQTDNPSGVPLHLNNYVKALKPDGTITATEIGRTADVNMDYRYQNTQDYSLNVDISVDIDEFPFPPIPIPLPVVLPVFGCNVTQFESVSSMKVIHRYGLLQSTTAQQYGSSVTTTNLVYDSETGEVLLNKTQNEFNDPVYSFKYPAHWAYTGMGPAYNNIGAEFNNVIIANGLITNMPSINQYFTAGDEVLAEMPWRKPEKLWVIDPNSMNPSSPHQIVFVDQYGKAFSCFNFFGSYFPVNTLKIVRSGHRNMQSMPIATLTSLQNPTSGGSINPVQADQILNTEATQYSEKWKVNCDQIPQIECDTCVKINCECMHNLLAQLFNNHLWNKHTADSAFVTLCCLDSGCAYPDGSPSGPLGCRNQVNERFYLNSNQFGISQTFYSASIGNYTLTIFKDPSLIYNGNNLADTNSLQLLGQENLIIENDSCYTVCDYYNKTGYYYIPSVVNNSAVVPYYARLTYNPNCKQICVNFPPDTVINPYRYGLLGNWRPSDKWVYRGFRAPGNMWANDAPSIRHNGYFDSYSPFWVYSSPQNSFVVNPSLSPNYIDATVIDKYNTKGAEIENQDAAGIYSSALYGYLESLATAVAKNSRYKNIANDNFEDYYFTTDCPNPCRSDHFSFRQSLKDGDTTFAVLDSAAAHTGNMSLKVLGSGPGYSTVVRSIVPDNQNPALVYDTVHHCYLLQADGCLPKFSPDSGKYYVSVWVKESQYCNALTYTNSSLKISFTGSTQTYEFRPHGNIIDGWQKIDSVFIMPGSATQIMVTLKSYNGTDVNFDDIRIEPFNSEMKTYVYDYRTTRLMAQLDENNYAVFYEYDDRGTPVRLKKETKNGVMTIQETRSTLKAK